MSTTATIDSIRAFKRASDTLKNLRAKYLEAIKKEHCDKYAMKFGGDDRFSVFKCTVFLDCHTGYYGNSSCSSLGSVDSALAPKLLNAALNKHMNLILSTMAEIAEEQASKLTEKAEAEIAELQALIDSAKSQGENKLNKENV
jgi:hypothetical protein